MPRETHNPIRDTVGSVLSARRITRLAREVGVVKRQRKVRVVAFVAAVVLGFRAHVKHAWYRQLSRRGQRAQLYTRDKQGIDKRFPLPKPRFTHPWPEQRFGGP